MSQEKLYIHLVIMCFALILLRPTACPADITILVDNSSSMKGYLSGKDTVYRKVIDDLRFWLSTETSQQNRIWLEWAGENGRRENTNNIELLDDRIYDLTKYNSKYSDLARIFDPSSDLVIFVTDGIVSSSESHKVDIVLFADRFGKWLGSTSSGGQRDLTKKHFGVAGFQTQFKGNYLPEAGGGGGRYRIDGERPIYLFWAGTNSTLTERLLKRLTTFFKNASSPPPYFVYSALPIPRFISPQATAAEPVFFDYPVTKLTPEYKIKLYPRSNASCAQVKDVNLKNKTHEFTISVDNDRCRAKLNFEFEITGADSIKIDITPNLTSCKDEPDKNNSHIRQVCKAEVAIMSTGQKSLNISGSDKRTELLQKAVDPNIWQLAKREIRNNWSTDDDRQNPITNQSGKTYRLAETLESVMNTVDVRLKDEGYLLGKPWKDTPFVFTFVQHRRPINHILIPILGFLVLVIFFFILFFKKRQ